MPLFPTSLTRALIVGVMAATLTACEKPAPAPELASKDDGMECLRVNDMPCAEANLRGYLLQYPNDSQTAAVLAIGMTKAGRHKQALYYYNKAVQGGQATYDLYAFYAMSLDAVGDIDNAIAYNAKALKIVPGLVDVRGDMARQLVRKGKPDEAIALLKWYDAFLKKQGQSPYFTAQIAAIQEQMAAKATAKP